MNLNKNQKRVLLAGVVLILAMFLVPPWTKTAHEGMGSRHYEVRTFAGYSFLLNPPYHDRYEEGVTVDDKLLLTQLAFLAAIVTGAMIYLKDSEQKAFR